MNRVGLGYDSHRFQPPGPLILGGVTIPFDRGLAGHSDADVVLHALMNALLGAMAEGDIGTHFPDSDPRYKDIASGKLLAKVLRIMREKRFRLVNADVTVVAQQPKLAPHYARIRKNVASLCSVAENKISIKATTTEKLGWAGQGKGMSATAIVLLSR